MENIRLKTYEADKHSSTQCCMEHHMQTETVFWRGPVWNRIEESVLPVKVPRAETVKEDLEGGLEGI